MYKIHSVKLINVSILCSYLVAISISIVYTIVRDVNNIKD
jgi:hypothetical protein